MSGILSKDTTLSYKLLLVFVEITLLMEVPEMGGDPEKVDVTTLADGVKRSIPGVKDLGDLTFKFLYDNESATSNYRVLKGLEDTATEFQLEYPDGTTHTFTAFVNVKMDSAAVNAALTFTANMNLQSDIVVVNPT
jgi:hypothetical protein